MQEFGFHRALSLLSTVDLKAHCKRLKDNVEVVKIAFQWPEASHPNTTANTGYNLSLTVVMIKSSQIEKLVGLPLYCSLCN